jgi:hypothetical protein
VQEAHDIGYRPPLDMRRTLSQHGIFATATRPAPCLEMRMFFCMSMSDEAEQDDALWTEFEPCVGRFVALTCHELWTIVQRKAESMLERNRAMLLEKEKEKRKEAAEVSLLNGANGGTATSGISESVEPNEIVFTREEKIAFLRSALDELETDLILISSCLIQARFGDFDPTRHVRGFLVASEVFPAAYLLAVALWRRMLAISLGSMGSNEAMKGVPTTDEGKSQSMRKAWVDLERRVIREHMKLVCMRDEIAVGRFVLHLRWLLRPLDECLALATEEAVPFLAVGENEKEEEELTNSSSSSTTQSPWK